MLKHDRPLLAILITNIALIPIEIIIQIMKYLNLTTVSGLEAMSTMWIPEGSLSIGILAGLGIGSWVGIIIYHSTKLWGTDYFPLKSMLIAMTVESIIFTLYGVLGRNSHLIQNVSGNFVHSFTAAFAGY